MKELNRLLYAWADDRNFFGGATITGQMCKFVEESGEIAEAWELKDRDKFIDGVGDCCVVARILCGLLNLNADEIIRDFKIVQPLDYYQDRNSYLVRMDVNRAFRDLHMTQGQLASCIAKGKDATVAMERVLRVLNELIIIMPNVTLTVAYRAAYDEIKDRKGEWIDGVFVKEADL